MSSTSRIATLIYGTISYLIFLGVFLYSIGFVGNFAVPKTVDSGVAGSLGVALAVNLGLLTIFALQHSIMARPAFKQWWTRFIPKPIERTTYVLVSTLLMILLFWQWQPMTQVVWQAQATWAKGLSWSLFILGIVVLFASTFVIDHFDPKGGHTITLEKHV